MNENENDSRNENLRSIYGPFYRMLTFTGFFLSTNRSSRLFKILTFVPIVVVLGLLLARAIYLFIQFKKAKTMTLLWCYIIPITFLAFHNLLSAFTLVYYGHKKYLHELLDLLTKASEKKITPVSKRLLAVCFILMAIFFFMSIVFIFDILLVYRPVNEDSVRQKQLDRFSEAHDIKNHINTSSENLNDTILKMNQENMEYRYIMFGGQIIFPLDIIIILIGTFMTSMAIIISMLSIRALSENYEKFNQEVRNLVKNHSLNNYNEIISIENRIMDYNKLARHIYFTDGTLISMSIMNGLIIHISAQFGMRAYSEGLPGLTAVVLVNWTILGMIMFIPFMLRPMEYYQKTTTTIEILLEEKSILGHTEMQISYVLDRIIMRLERADYAKYILVPIKSSIFSVKALLFLIMFGIDIFAAYWKKIPQNCIQT